MGFEKAVQVRITGRVQGVSFRAWARDEARGLGLTGWVRNERDGSVSALLSGPAEAVSAMIERLREGPPAARVANVVVVEAAAQESRPTLSSPAEEHDTYSASSQFWPTRSLPKL